MEITIQEISQHNRQDAGQCDSTFTVDAVFVLAVQDNLVQFSIAPVPSYQKQYPKEAVDYNAYIDCPDQVVFFAYADTTIAGEIRLRRNWNRYAYVEDLVVSPCFRRCGIGRMLIQAAVEWAQRNRLPGVMLETQNNNVAACRLYRTCGFEVGGFDRFLYHGIDPHTEEVALYWYLTFEPEQQSG